MVSVANVHRIDRGELPLNPSIHRRPGRDRMDHGRPSSAARLRPSERASPPSEANALQSKRYPHDFRHKKQNKPIINRMQFRIIIFCVRKTMNSFPRIPIHPGVAIDTYTSVYQHASHVPTCMHSEITSTFHIV